MLGTSNGDPELNSTFIQTIRVFEFGGDLQIPRLLKKDAIVRYFILSHLLGLIVIFGS